MPVCNETEFKKRLTNMQLPRIAFIFGEEKFLVHHYTDKLSEKAVGKHPSEFNFHTFDSKSTIDEIAQAALAVPFMADLLLIKVLDLDVESLSDNQYKKFQELLTIVPSSTVLVFSWPTFDIGNKKSAKWKKLVEAVSKTEDGVVFELSRKTPKELAKLIISKASKENCILSEANAMKIVTYNGNDLQSLQNEVEKLCAFTVEGEITQETIDMLVTKNLEAKVFALSDAVVTGDITKAMAQLDVLMFSREEPIAVLAVLSNAYVDMYRVKATQESGESTSALAEKFPYKGKEFVISKAERNARKLTLNALRRCLDELVEADLRLKSTRADGRIVLEELISKLFLIHNQDDYENR